MKLKTLNYEKIILILIGLSFFIGTWHAFPMLNVVNDEMYYVGGVLRAMENHTIIPAPGDVPYGTLTYLASYAVTLVTLPIYLIIFKFKLQALKLYLIQSPYLVYFSLRLISACFSLGILYFVNKLLKEVVEKKTRLFLLILLFSNIITLTILHTGKMWVLSEFLVIISFYYLYKSLNEFENKSIFLSILFSFLALANFPLNLYSLICVPTLFYFFRNDRAKLKKIFLYAICGLLAYVLITLFNFQGIRAQIISIFTEYHPISSGLTQNLNFIDSLKVYVEKLFILFPISILVLLLSLKKNFNKKLLAISGLYFLSYFILITLVANWVTDLKTSLRYLFPLGFFVILLAASFEPKFKKSFYLIGGVSFFIGVTALYYLSIPTTYNLAYDWVNTNLKNQSIVIVNEIPQLELVKNKISSQEMLNVNCATKCRNIIAYNLNSDFKPEVIDPLSKDWPPTSLNYSFLITDHLVNNSNLTLAASFIHGNGDYHSMDYNFGNYFDPSFFTSSRLGKNIYIYKKI